MAKTQDLAQWFVTQILKQEFDYRFARQHLKAAKELVNPKDKSVKPLDMEVVKLCIEALARGEFGFEQPVTSLYAVTWGTPSYYERMVQKIASIPPPYVVRDYDSWVLEFGKKAIELGFWSGSYQGWGNPHDQAFRLTPDELVAAITA